MMLHILAQRLVHFRLVFSVQRFEPGDDVCIHAQADRFLDGAEELSAYGILPLGFGCFRNVGKIDLTSRFFLQ